MAWYPAPPGKSNAGAPEPGEAGTVEAVYSTRRRGDAETRRGGTLKRVNTKERGGSGETWAGATRVWAEGGASIGAENSAPASGRWQAEACPTQSASASRPLGKVEEQEFGGAIDPGNGYGRLAGDGCRVAGGEGLAVHRRCAADHMYPCLPSRFQVVGELPSGLHLADQDLYVLVNLQRAAAFG